MSEDLATWLLEQIAEDERLAAALQTAPATTPHWEHRNAGTVHPGVYEQGRIYTVLNDEYFDEMLAYVANWDPARTLAECDAKRRRLAHIADELDEWRAGWHDGNDRERAIDGWMALLKLEALPYADRSGYRPV